jgi:hypothetical protein
VRTEPGSSSYAKDYDDIRMVQLVVASEGTAKSLRRSLQRRVVVRGQLVEGTPGMQRTAVVMEVEAVRRG